MVEQVLHRVSGEAGEDDAVDLHVLAFELVTAQAGDGGLAAEGAEAAPLRDPAKEIFDGQASNLGHGSARRLRTAAAAIEAQRARPAVLVLFEALLANEVAALALVNGLHGRRVPAQVADKDFEQLHRIKGGLLVQPQLLQDEPESLSGIQREGPNRGRYLSATHWTGGESGEARLTPVVTVSTLDPVFRFCPLETNGALCHGADVLQRQKVAAGSCWNLNLKTLVHFFLFYRITLLLGFF